MSKCINKICQKRSIQKPFFFGCLVAWLVEITPRIRLRPRILRDVSVSDTRTTILGNEISFPVGIAPTAFHCLAWHEGELATARGKHE